MGIQQAHSCTAPFVPKTEYNLNGSVCCDFPESQTIGCYRSSSQRTEAIRTDFIFHIWKLRYLISTAFYWSTTDISLSSCLNEAVLLHQDAERLITLIKTRPEICVSEQTKTKTDVREIYILTFIIRTLNVAATQKRVSSNSLNVQLSKKSSAEEKL